MEESKSFSRAPVYYHWVLFIFIYLFVYLLIFRIDKSLLTIVNKIFYNLNLLKLFWDTEAVSQRCSPGGGCSADLLRIFGGVSVRGCDFNKAVNRLYWDGASVLFFPVDVLHVWRASFLENNSGGVLQNKDNFIYNFYLFFLINYTFEDFKVSVLL